MDYQFGYRSPMDAAKGLTQFLEILKEDTVKAQIIEIYLEDNPSIRKLLLDYLDMDGLM